MIRTAGEKSRQSLRESARIAVKRLSTSWVSLFFALLLLNAIFRPYAGIVHDARLYAVQVLNHVEPGRYSDDLYLKFGSQDSYSLFSWVVAPVAEIAGVTTTFFVLYLISNSIFLLALLRLVQALVKHRGVAVVALVYMAVNPLAFGGLGTFRINENFLTPRLMAIALVLLGLERLVRARPVAALGWTIAALLVHPIMAFSGLLIWVTWQLWKRLDARAFVALLVIAGIAVAVVLIRVPLGTAILGHMDDAWRQRVVVANPYAVPTAWDWSDWLGIAIAFAILAVARTRVVADAGTRRLLDSIMLVGAVGIVVGTVAPHLPYALLIQGQAYRAVWPLQLVQVPMLFALLGSVGAGATVVNRGVAFALLAGFAWVAMSGLQFLAAAVVWAAYHVWRGVETTPTGRPASAVRLAPLACLALAVVPIGIAAFRACYELWPLCPPIRCLASVPGSFGPFFTGAAALGVLVLLFRWAPSRLPPGTTAIVGCLVVQTTCFVIPLTSLYELWGVRRAEDVAFVGDYLKHQQAGDPRSPTIYWPMGPLDDIWITLRSKSFFSVPQVAGNMFNRGTAMEASRRARLTRRFELSVRSGHLHLLPDWVHDLLRGVFGADRPVESPSLRDLQRLCRDEPIDLLVLPEKFDGWYAATNGRIYLYDSRAIRRSSPVRRTSSSVDRSLGLGIHLRSMASGHSAVAGASRGIQLRAE